VINGVFLAEFPEGSDKIDIDALTPSVYLLTRRQDQIVDHTHVASEKGGLFLLTQHNERLICSQSICCCADSLPAYYPGCGSVGGCSGIGLKGVR